MGLSSNILWHQTSYLGLTKILQSQSIKCAYSKESIQWKHNQQLDMAFPMISFCDIPFADISEYLKKYGGYSIGFKNSCRRKWGVSPVWYRSRYSDVLKTQMDVWKLIKDKRFENFSDSDKLLWGIVSYTKNTNGKLRKYGFENYCFYDEREYRWCPSWEVLIEQGIKPFLSAEEYEEYYAEHRRKEPYFSGDFYLDFTAEDIAYIITSDRPGQVQRIKKMLNGIENIPILSHKKVQEDIIGIGHHKSI